MATLKVNTEQALQEAIDAHMAGKLEVAEHIYRAILQSKPNHPHANHNLGVIAMSMGKAGAALPLFRAALEANPKQGQFWLSYLDALIKEKHFDNAMSVLEQGKRRGLVGEKVDALESHLRKIILEKKQQPLRQAESLTLSNKNKNFSLIKKNRQKLSKNKKPNYQIGAPLKTELDILHNYYIDKKYDIAENLALSITLKFPNHQFSWKILGAIFKHTGQLQKSLSANQKAIELNPYDPETHNNVGTTLHELGRLESAETSYKRAIDIAPLYTEAYYNLGITQKELGRAQEAELSFKKALSIKPDLLIAKGKLGILYFEQGKYRQASEQLLNLKNTALDRSYILKCWYFLNEKELFYKELDQLTDHEKNNAIVGSFICRAEIKYGIKIHNPFCNNPLKYVFTTNLNNEYDFKSVFVEPVISILKDTKMDTKKQSLLTNGNQTAGNLFFTEDLRVANIKNIIHSEIIKYRKIFYDGNEGLFNKWPEAYTLYGWIISMQSGGELRAHMHEKGWLSGSIYINVPPKIKHDSGNLVVCLNDDEHLTKEKTSNEKSIDVVTGSMCLFPASVLHYTVPFESNEHRIVLAFDVVPKIDK